MSLKIQKVSASYLHCLAMARKNVRGGLLKLVPLPANNRVKMVLIDDPDMIHFELLAL